MDEVPHPEESAVVDDANEATPVTSPPSAEAELTPADSDPSPVADDEPPVAADGSNAVDEEPPAIAEEPPSTDSTEPDRSSLNVEGSQITVNGDLMMIASLRSVLKADDQSHKTEEEKPLYDFVKPLPRRPDRVFVPSPDELEAQVDALRENRLLVISSPHFEYAFDAAWAVIEGLPGSPRRFTGMLDSEDVRGTNVEFSLPRLLDQRREAEAESVLLVDALPSSAQSFPESFLRHSARADSLKEILRNSRHFLVVIVDLAYARRNELATLARLKNFAHRIFPYWEIPFLETFIKYALPNDEEQYLREIHSQQKRGLWEKDEVSFVKQVLSYFYGDRLREVIQEGGPKDPVSSAESLLKTATPVKKTAVYAGTFFQEITTTEFSRVVEALLGNQTARTAPAKSVSDGEETERLLRRTWDLEKDEIFSELLVETVGASDSLRTVNLAESNLREPLRRLFEKQHRFYLLDQFKTIQEEGLFFHPSLRLADNTTRIAVEMARTYPEEFNHTWIVSLIKRFKQHTTNDARDDAEAVDRMFRFLVHRPGASNLAFTRICDLCQRLLESPQHKDIVSQSLEHLMRIGYHEQVLGLIKKLKFSEDFDEWYWLKQLLHQADAKTRYQTYYYVISYLKRLGPGVYDALGKLASLLPPADRKSYSEGETFVFRLFIKYCLDTIERFDADDYGKWPTRYPLFVFRDVQTALQQTSVLAEWLLHPAVDRTLAGLRIRGTRMTLIGGLLAEWSFIVLGPNNSTRWNGDTIVKPTDAGAELTPSALFHLLLRQFLGRLDFKQQLELLKYWNRLYYSLFNLSVSPLQSTQLQEELSWKRDLVWALIEAIKSPEISAKPNEAACLTN